MRELIIGATEFKAKCLRILEEVADRGHTVIITKRGKALAKVVPIEKTKNPLKERWKGLAKTKGDIIHFDTSKDWGALR